MHAFRSLVISCAVLATGAAEAHTQDVALLVGEWRFNLQASRCARNLCPREETRTFEDAGGGYVLATHSGINSSGGSTFSSYRARHDGSQYSFVRVGPGVAWRPETISFTPVDARTSEWTMYNNGRMTSEGMSTVSEDGQTYTVATRNGATLVFRRR
jgi:hypothetical protein